MPLARPAQAPRPIDTVEVGDNITVCDVPKVAGVTVTSNNAGFGATLTLSSDLEVTGDFRTFGDFTLKSEDATTNRHKLTISGNASLFSLDSCFLCEVDIVVGSASNHTPITLFSEGSSLHDVNLTNYGDLCFIETPQTIGSPSAVVNKSGGKLEARKGLDYFGSLVNEGMLKFTMVNAPNGADLDPTLLNSGTVIVYDRTLMVRKWISQTAGEFQLHNADVHMASSQPLEKELFLKGGSLTGNGTIIGAVVLGQQGMNGSPSISPGIDDQIATTVDTGLLFITQYLTINTTDASVIVELDNATKYDEVKVGGIATLNGALTVKVPATYNPSIGTSYKFIRSLSVVGDFVTRTLTPAGLTWQSQGQTLTWKWEKVGTGYRIVADLV